MRRLFVFGLGYTTTRLGRRLIAEGWRVAGTTRSPEKRERLAHAGFEAFLFGEGVPLRQTALSGTTHILSSAAPVDGRDPVLAAHEADIAALPGLSWLGYLSTTGVYGDRGGATVDENDEPRPSSPRTAARVEAEQAWLALADRMGLPAAVFRIGGIYGPGRSAFDQLRAGSARRFDKPGHVFSRIHVDDIGRVIEAAMARPRPGAIYNVCDDEPAAAADVTAEAARLLGIEPPPLQPFDPALLSPMARAFWSDSRRVSNRRIREELSVRLAFPTYREGLAAVLAEGG